MLEEEDEENFGPHLSHCCKEHGCKYGEDNCPVVTGQVVQQFRCEECPASAKAVKTRVKSLEKELLEAKKSLAVAEALDETFRTYRQRESERLKYRIKNTTRSDRALRHILEQFKDAERHDCSQCGRNLIIALDETHPLYNDYAYKTNSVNTIRFEPDAFASEIKGDNTPMWICKECNHNNYREI